MISYSESILNLITGIDQLFAGHLFNFQGLYAFRFVFKAFDIVVIVRGETLDGIPADAPAGKNLPDQAFMGSVEKEKISRQKRVPAIHKARIAGLQLKSIYY